MEAAEEVGGERRPERDGVRVLSVDKVTVEKIVLESSTGSREVLLTKNESSRKLSIKRGERKEPESPPKSKNIPDDGSTKRIKPIRFTKRPCIGSIAVAGLNLAKIPPKVPQKPIARIIEEPASFHAEEDEQREGEQEIAAKDRLEQSRTKIEDLQQNLGTRIDADTAQRYKEKLLELRANCALKLPVIVDANANEKSISEIVFDEGFLRKHGLDERLRIEENRLLETDLDHVSEDVDECIVTSRASKPSYSKKVSEVEKRWSGEFLERHSSESSKSSYVEEFGSVSSRESVAEERARGPLLFDQGSREFESEQLSVDERQTSVEVLVDSTDVSTVDSDSCVEERIKAADEDIEGAGSEVRESQETEDDASKESVRLKEEPEEPEGSTGSCQDARTSSTDSINWTFIAQRRQRDGYASLIREFSMEAGSSRVKKEEKQKKKLGLRRLLPGFFSPKDSRKEYKKKEAKERKKHDDRHFARYQQNGNYTRSPDTMNLNEDIKRNVKLDNSLNGSIIEERLDEIKRELFPEQGPITSTPDHFARDDDRGLLRDRAGPPRSYATDSSLSSIAPDDRWGERNAHLGISPDIRKFEQRHKREELGQRYGQLERKHSLQEANHVSRTYFFHRNHGPSGRISAPPTERYLVRPRAIHPVDRPLPAIPHSRTELANYENYLEEQEESPDRTARYGKAAYAAEKPEYLNQPALYANESASGLILKSVSAQVKITRQPIVNQNQRAPLIGRSPKYPSSGSSQKSGDYADSSCTPNSSQKSEFSPSSSKSGEYYLHSPRDSGSPNVEDFDEDPRREGIYENEKSPSRSSTRCMDDRIYDETPMSPCEHPSASSSRLGRSMEECLDKRVPPTSQSPQKSLQSPGKVDDGQRRGDPGNQGGACSPASPSGSQGKVVSSPGRVRPPSRRAQPNEQILIASPKRDVGYETRIPRPSNDARRRGVESPVHLINSPHLPPTGNSLDTRTQEHTGSQDFPSPRITTTNFSTEIPRPEPIYGHRNQPVPSKRTVASPSQKDCDDRVAWVQGQASSPGKSPQKSERLVVQSNSGRSPDSESHRQQGQPVQSQRSRAAVQERARSASSSGQTEAQRSPEEPAAYAQRVPEPVYGQRGALSPSKQQTRQHLEAFYWQQKALEARRKSVASPVTASPRQIGRKIDLPEVREAVYWQQLKKLDEEQQRRIYEQNQMEDGQRSTSGPRGIPKPTATRQGPVQTPATTDLTIFTGDPSAWTSNLRRPKANPTGKPPLMQSQKGQNQPVLIVRPQQAIRDRREIPSKPLNPARQETQRSKSASPHLHRGDGHLVPRKLETLSAYEEDANDIDGKTAPPPIFKRGSLVGGESVEYGTAGAAKRVSFSNQSAVGQDLASGSWPTKRGTAPEPPTRRHRSEDSASDTDSVFFRDPHCPEGAEYDADRPLPPLPKDPASGIPRPAPPRSNPYGDPRWNTGTASPVTVGIDHQTLLTLRAKEEEWNPDGKGRQSNDTGGSGRGDGEAGSNEVPSGRRGGGGGVGSGLGGGGGGSVLGVGGGSGNGRSGSGGGGRSRDEPRRHTLGGDHQPSLHHQQFNAAQQLHPLHPHHLPPPHGQYGTQPARHTTMDLESPLPRGYPPPSSTMLFDDDPGIMSEVETSSTGFRRGGKQRSSLPVVRTPSKTLERPLGLVFLQYRNETKRALLPNEITSIDTVKALFVRSFPKQLTMEYLDSPHVKVYIHDSNKDMFYELEDLRSHLRDIRDRSVLRLFESSDGVTGMPGPLGIPGGGSGLPPHWEDQSYFSEPEFDSEYQHQHIHKSKTAKNSTSGSSGYYVGGSSTLPRGGQLMRAYSPAASSVVGGPTATPTQPKPLATPDRLHGESGYMSSPERGGGVGSGTGRYPPGPYSAGSSYEESYYSQFSGTVTPVIDEEARIRVEHMERQLANLTGLVQKALTHAPHTSPSPRDYLQVPAGRDPYARGPDKSVSFEKSVSFSDEPPDMNSPKQHSPQHAADTKPTKPAIKSSTLPRMSSQERDRHKPTPPPKPASLVAGQYVYRDLALTPEMYNQLRGLQKKAKDLRQEVRNLRRMSQAQAHTVRETIRDTFITIRAMLMSGGDAAWSAGDAEKIRLSREEDLYKQEMLRLEKDLTELESTVEELRGNVINRKTRVNMSDVENMALILSKSSKTVADLKVRFPSLQEGMKGLLSSEMEKVVREEKFLKEEPERLESALRRCKKLTGTLVTLKRLASVQEQRLPNAASVDAEETPPVTPTSAQHSKAAAPVPAERTVVGSASVIGGGAHPHEPSAAHQQRPENALDALLDELQTFSRPSSQLGHVAPGSTTILADLGRSGSREVGPVASAASARPPSISDIGRKGSVDSSSGVLAAAAATPPQTAGGTLRRLHSYPSSSDTDTSPPIARLQVSLQEQPSLPVLPQGFVPGQKPPVPERNAELLQLATARRVPPPPPPRTSSRSPLASPTSPQLPPRNHSCNLQSGNATLRRPPARGTLPVKEGKPPMALPADASTGVAPTLEPASVLLNSSSSQSSAVLSTSNSSSCESVNSQEGLQNKKGRQEQLEQRHQELLRKQKALQEQYARLQQLQRNTAGLTTVPPAPPDLLKKTGSESNLLAKMGLGLSTASSGSLTSLTAKSASQEASVDGNQLRQEDLELQIESGSAKIVNSMAAAGAIITTTPSNESIVGQAPTANSISNAANILAAGTTATTTSKIYETDIL